MCVYFFVSECVCMCVCLCVCVYVCVCVCVDNVLESNSLRLKRRSICGGIFKVEVTVTTSGRICPSLVFCSVGIFEPRATRKNK